jgi:hypothetical protein
MVARLRLRDSGGTLRTITQLRMRDSGGTLRTISRVRLRDANNVLRIVYEPSGASAFTAGASNSVVSGHTLGTGTATTNTTTVTPTGGTAPYTYAWARLSYTAGVAPTATASTAATTAFTQTGMALGGEYTSMWRCTVTDALGLTATADVEAFFVDTT